MVFWRKKKNPAAQEQEERDDKLLRHKNDPELEPATEYDAEMDEATKKELGETEEDIIDNLKAVPVPEHNKLADVKEAEEWRENAEGGGWLSRLTHGLSKSANKFSQGLSDVLTKSKLDAEALERLEELLIAADLGPKTAAKIIEDFSSSRFGKEISEEEIRTALAESIEKILTLVAVPLSVKKPEDGPFVVLVAGVNGAGKTTTIGKLAYHLEMRQKKKVMMAAGDTFRVAAVEQLEEWGKRAHCPVVKKDIGDDAAAVAFEAYELAKEQGRDVLLVDTAGRLQNKANLMAELEKIIRVLKKQDENLPHAVILVLDATTGQNAFSQLETFKDMVDVTGLAVTKLDGSAKGGVLVGLADQFGIPVHLVGIGEGPEDLQPFDAKHYAQSLVGLIEC